MSLENPLITVYITNYNYQKYIEQSIQSVLQQTVQNFELIIIDDGSTDNSKAIIERYRDDPRVTIIYQQNKGLNITNNVAMRVSKAKYIMRLDADDYLANNALEAMSKMLEKDPALGLVFPDYYYIDAAGEITGQEQRHDFDREVSLYDQPAHGACTMIRLSYLKKLGGYNESFTCQDGYDLWLKFITHYSVSNINKPLFYYRQHGENLTTNENRILDTRRAIKAAFLEEKENRQDCALMVIPVRNTKIKGQSWPLLEVNGATILEHKVATCLKAKCCGQVAIVTSNPEVLAYASQTFATTARVRVIERPDSFAGPNQTLRATVDLAVQQTTNSNLRYVLTAALEYPFLQAAMLDDAINTILLFKSDAVLSVRPDNKSYYRHTGHGLSSILDQEKFTRLEREALYKAAGGLMVSTMASFKKHKKINAGQISHVVVDEKAAFGVHSQFEFEVFKSIGFS